jgi:hypothetical protein
MMQSLTCTLPAWDYASSYKVYTNLCKPEDVDGLCRGVETNLAVGEWGSYVHCNMTERTAYALNQLYLRQRLNASVCTDAGGIFQQPVAEKVQENDCKDFLRQVGPDGIGRVTVTPVLKERENHIGPGKSIAVLVGISLICIITFTGLGAFIMYRRRRKKVQTLEEKNKAQELPGDSKENGQTFMDDAAELYGPGIYELNDTRRAEIAGNERMELAGDDVPELHGIKDEPSELEGSEVPKSGDK